MAVSLSNIKKRPIPWAVFFKETNLKTAVFIDGAYFLKRFKYVFPQKDITNPQEVAKALFSMCLSHLADKNQEETELYRIFYYDCPPLMKKVHYPISKKCLDFSKTSTAIFKEAFINELKKKRKCALRLGRLQDLDGWILSSATIKKLLQGKIKFEDLNDDDFEYGIRQKQIDMKIGVDIASVAYKKQAQRIVLVAGDADFVPAAKLARREGVDFILDPMWKSISADLFEHIDGLKTYKRFAKSKKD